MRVLVKSAMSPYSGYGSDGIGIVMALLRLGVDVYLDPAHVQAPLPPVVASLLTKRLSAPFDLCIQHVDPGQLGISPEARRSAKTTVAWTMWEFTTLDNLKGRSRLRKALRDFDLVLGYDTVSSAALAPYVSGASKLDTVQGGFWPEQWPKATRDWHSDRFGFCMVGALNQRKDPFVAIQAFKELKDEYPDEFDGAELHLKTNQPGLHPSMEEWCPKLRVHYSVWPDDVMREFYANQHCLLAPSRGEGKNLPALEMLSTGGTVIATNWGGHQQWLSEAYGYGIDYDLVPVDMSTPDCKNARARKDHLKAQMWQVYRNRDEAGRKGDRAAVVIPQMCSWDAVIDRLFLKLNANVTGAGPLLVQARDGRDRAQEAPGRG